MSTKTAKLTARGLTLLPVLFGLYEGLTFKVRTYWPWRIFELSGWQAKESNPRRLPYHHFIHTVLIVPVLAWIVTVTVLGLICFGAIMGICWIMDNW